MRRVFLVVVVAAMSWPASKAGAQTVCEDVTLSGPSLTVSSPILSVGIGPLVTTHSTTCRSRRRVAQAYPPPPPPPPAMAPPPPPPPAPVRVVAVPPPPPRVVVVPRLFRLGITIGGYVDSPLYADGALAGAGFQFRYRFMRELAITATVSGLTSCTRCNKDAKNYWRRDATFTVGLMYFPFPRWIVAPYVRGAFVADVINFGVDGSRYSYNQFGFESGLGVEWRLTRHLALFADASGLVLGGNERRSDGGGVDASVPSLSSSEEENMKGVPLLSGRTDVAARLRLGLVFKF